MRSVPDTGVWQSTHVAKGRFMGSCKDRGQTQ